MKTIAEELRELAELIAITTVTAKTQMPPDTNRLLSRYTNRLLVLATRCEGMVSLEAVEEAVRVDLDERWHEGELTVEQAGWICDSIVVRLKGGA